METCLNGYIYRKYKLNKIYLVYTATTTNYHKVVEVA